MGNAKSGDNESHESGLLEHPHYTKPQIFEGMQIPKILTSGDHEKITQWKQTLAREITIARRPDMIVKQNKKDS